MAEMTGHVRRNTHDDYIAITTRQKEQNGYGKLTAELKAAYDKVAPIRDKCVRQINVKK